MLTKQITTVREYRIARAEVAGLEEQLEKQEVQTQHLDPRLRQALRSATESRIDELRARLLQYEQLRHSGGAVVELLSLDDLPSLLVQARIAANLTQEDLAKLLGVSPQQVQKDERGQYAKASMQRLVKVAAALGMPLSLTAILPSPGSRKGHMIEAAHAAEDRRRRQELRESSQDEDDQIGYTAGDGSEPTT